MSFSHVRPVLLVGCGVVGTEIARSHLDRGVAVTIVDLSATAVRIARESLIANDGNVILGDDRYSGPGRPVSVQSPDAFEPLREINLHFETIQTIQTSQSSQPTVPAANSDKTQSNPIVIESVAEVLEIKQQLLGDLQSILPSGSVLCTNTSTLRVDDIARPLRQPEQFCGMHFFMPVTQRDAVEVIAGVTSSGASISVACEHAVRIGKTPLRVPDTAGFIVNRMLSPYLNEALLMLCEGVSATRLKAAAIDYGMPMSPLELIDQIGPQTMFLSGHAFLRAYPGRMDPSPLIGRLIKSLRTGKSTGKLLSASGDLLAEVADLAASYQRASPNISADEIGLRMRIPMMIEASMLRRTLLAQPRQPKSQPRESMLQPRESMLQPRELFDAAMSGGLGFRGAPNWSDKIAATDDAAILRCINKFGDVSAALRLPAELDPEALKTF